MPLTLPKLVRVGHSPDPDDAFMFYALAKAKIPMNGFEVQHVIEDIECLNQRALKNELEVTAVSCHAYAYLADHYLAMPCGASVGDNYGPILVAREASAAKFKKTIHGAKIAVPGKLTTAYLILQLFEAEFEPVFIPFDQIFDAVESGQADLGLVIHEGQITFSKKGFEKIMDLGEWWHDQTNLPLPLGVDIIRRDLGQETIVSFTKLFKASIEYALAHRQDALKYALTYGRGISEKLGDQFVGMYVNHFTVDLGKKGEQGFEKLLSLAYDKRLIPCKIIPEFVRLE
ncbi:MAG: ABC transporter substrate-binding protein [Candidatus Omnitrophica bacterium]|nr:ABC transporter substrate-binding protein [Candidatus Omnitrophota bacterium]